MEKDKDTQPPTQTEIPAEESPPYRPDPELITFLERKARPEVVKSPQLRRKRSFLRLLLGAP